MKESKRHNAITIMITLYNSELFIGMYILFGIKNIIGSQLVRIGVLLLYVWSEIRIGDSKYPTAVAEVGSYSE